MTEVTPIEKVILEKEAEEIGGMVVVIWGEQGAGKTMALVKMVMKDMGVDKTGQKFDPNNVRRIPLWKGQDSCQWILLAANNLPVTLWMHESINDYQFYLTGSKKDNINKRKIDLERIEDLDVEIKTYSNQEELIDKLHENRVNVYYIPGAKGGLKEKYFYQKQNLLLDNALNERDYGDHITLSRDEISNEASTMRKGDFYELQEFEFPQQWEDFRKNNVSMRGAGHSHTDVNYKLHKVKSTGTVYMQNSVVHSRHRQIKQKYVNQMKRGEFVIPGFETGKINMPRLPKKVFDWMPDNSDVKLKVDIDASIPDIRPKEEDIETWLDEQAFQKKHLEDIIDVSEASELTNWSNREIRRKLSTGKLKGLKLDGKWVLSMSMLVNDEKIPINS